MTNAALGSFLQTIFLIACTLTTGKLWISGLYKRYPIFFLYFLFRIPNTIWPFFFDIRTISYLNMWRITSFMALILYILLVGELYRLVLEKYEGLQTIGRWAMFVSLAFSVIISVLSFAFKIRVMSLQSQKVRFVLDTERGVYTALAIFICLLLAFLSRYPISLSRNVRLHALVYSAFFLSSTVSILMVRLFWVPLEETLNLAVTGINTRSVYIWLIFLHPAAQWLPSVEPTDPREPAQRLLSQLDALNTAALRMSRQHIR